MPDSTAIQVYYLHLDSIDPKITAGFSSITKGQPIGTLGDANGFYAGMAHLHFEARWKTPADCPPIKTLPIFASDPYNYECDPYVSILNPADAVDYTAPTLFVDDRANPVTTALNGNAWTEFVPPAVVPSSSAYVETADHKRLSLDLAARSGAIYSVIYFYDNASNSWTAYPDMANIVFQTGVYQAVYSYTSGNQLTIFPIEGRSEFVQNDRNDRARLDLVHVVSDLGAFTSVKMENFPAQPNLGWNPPWKLRSVPAVGASGEVTIYHITNGQNPLERIHGIL